MANERAVINESVSPAVSVSLVQAFEEWPVTDPGFPRGGGANPPGGGAPLYDFAKFSQKMHEIERIWTPGTRMTFGETSILLFGNCTDKFWLGYLPRVD